MLTKDEFLKPRDRVCININIDGLGGVVRIRALTTAERSRFEASLQRNGKPDPKKIVLVREKLIVLSVVDANDQQMFSEEDIPEISKLPARAVEQLFNEVRELSGFSEGDVESLEKNSD